MIKQKKYHFMHRPDMSLDEIWRQYYKDANIKQETIKEIFELVSNSTDIPVGKLRPSDRFDKELAPAKGWEFSDGLVEIRWWLEQKVKDTSKLKDISDLKTLDDLIKYKATAKCSF